MAKPIGSELESVQNALPERGNIRLDELATELDRPTEHIAPELFELVRDGKVALFPVGEQVIIRLE
jgi:hypothetical protein